LKAEPLDRRDDVANALSLEILRIEGGRREKKGKALKEIHFRYFLSAESPAILRAFLTMV
jgi:hypothetical protein